MKFIEMTTLHGHIVWVRADAIAAISYVGPHTHVWLDGIIDGFVVNETPEQIMEMAAGTHMGFRPEPHTEPPVTRSGVAGIVTQLREQARSIATRFDDLATTREFGAMCDIVRTLRKDIYNLGQNTCGLVGMKWTDE